MKKVLSIIAVGAFVFSMASCKKDQTCTCTTMGVSTAYAYGKVKTKDAEASCETLDALSPSTTCTL